MSNAETNTGQSQPGLDESKAPILSPGAPEASGPAGPQSPVEPNPPQQPAPSGT